MSSFMIQAECKMQFAQDTLAVKECSEAVKSAYGAGAVGCFPSTATVCRKGDGSISMDRLCVGDEVLVVDSYGIMTYQPVLTFLHLVKGSHNIKFDFLKISHRSGDLEIHPDHLISVTRRGRTTYIPARELMTGDSLSSVWIDGSFCLSHVLSVEHVEKKGLYCPLTQSGTIIVDGVWCSCYSPPAGEAVGCHFSHEMCHLSLFPLRMVGASAGPVVEGIHPYCQALMSLSN